MIRTLGRWLAFALPLGALLLALERGLLLAAAHSEVREPGKVNRILRHQVDPELMIFGSSNALTAFDAPLIEAESGRSTYNAGLSGTLFVQYRGLVREFADYSRRARDVVLAETFLTFDPLPAIAAPGRLLPYVDVPAVAETLDEIDPTLARRLRSVPLYSFVVADGEYYRTAARGLSSLLHRPPADNLRLGFQAVEQPFQRVELRSRAAPSPRLEERFVETLELLRRRGLRPVVVVTPVQAGCQGSVPGLAAHRRRLRELTAGRGVFLDYTLHPVAAAEENFYNCGHLNARGAARFSRAFVVDLRDAGGGG